MRFFFGAPGFFWLLIPALAAGPWLLLRRGLRGQARARSGLVLLVVLALARPCLELEREVSGGDAAGKPGPDLLLVLDTSPSLGGRGRARARDYLARVAASPNAGELQVLESPGPLWETAAAAAAAASAGRAARLVLLTDGRFPQAERRGLVELARHSPFPIDVVPLPPGEAGQVRVEEVRLDRDEWRVGETLVADIRVVWAEGGEGSPPGSERSAARPADPKLGVSLNGEKIAEMPLPGPGTYRRRFAHPLRQIGPHDLTAWTAQAGLMARRFDVLGQTEVLLAAGDRRDARMLAAALQSGGFRVSWSDPAGLPRDADSLRRFDAVVLHDVPPILDDEQDRVLNEYVRGSGGGLVFVAGPLAFGLGAHAGTRLGRLLPITPEIPKEIERYRVALGLVLDTSGSMAEEAGGQRKLDLVVEAARQAVELLKPGLDEVGVVAFAGDARWVVPLGQLGAIEDLKRQLEQVSPGGETELLPALTQMRVALEGSSARIRHVLVLSDGRTAGQPEDFHNRVEEMASAGITVSTVAVGPAAQEALLAGLASRGGGGFYAARSAEDLPRIFTEDTRRHTRSGLIEEPTGARLREEGPWRGALDVEAAPPLLGHVASRIRPSCHLALETEAGLPLLAWTPRGAGRVGAFASDASGRWARLWIDRWSGYSAFWCQFVRFCARAQKPDLSVAWYESPSASGIRLELGSSTPEQAGVPLGPERPAGPWPLACLHESTGMMLTSGTAMPLDAQTFWVELPDALRPGPYRLRLGGLDGRREKLLEVPDYSEAEWASADEPFLREVAQMGEGRYHPEASGPWPRGRPRPPRYPLSSLLLVLAVVLLILEAAWSRAESSRNEVGPHVRAR